MVGIKRYYSLKHVFIELSELVMLFAISCVTIVVQPNFVQLNVEAIINNLSVTSITFFLMFYYFELYTPDFYPPGRGMVRKLASASLVASIALYSLYFFYPSLSIGVGRRLLLLNAFALPLFIIAWRTVFTEFLSLEFPEKRVLIIGNGELAKKISKEINRGWNVHGLKPIGFIADSGYSGAATAVKNGGENLNGTVEGERETVGDTVINNSTDLDDEIIGGFGDIEGIVDSQKIYKIIVALQDRRAKLPMSALLKCKLGGVRVVEGESFLEEATGKVPVGQLKPSWLVFSDGFGSLRSKKIISRGFDILLSLTGLILSSPIILITAILIKLESRGPIIYKQVRVGENGKEFEVLKFRSMAQDAEAKSGPVWATTNDSRVTRVGKVIRKLRIDEIPQMVNALKGDMSFVGPRPERPGFVEELKKKIPYYEIRTVVKPGITGWAQVKYPYGATVEDSQEKLQFDLYYIKNMSPLMNLIIIGETIKVVLTGKGAR